MDLYIVDLGKQAAEMAAIIKCSEFEKLSFWANLSEDTQKHFLVPRDALNAGDYDTFCKLLTKGVIP